MWTRLAILGALAVSLQAMPVAAQTAAPDLGDPGTNTIFIFDASGSMKRPAGNETRISAAKRVFGQMLDEMPMQLGSHTGLIVFGHRRKKDCSDIEVVSPLGDHQARDQAELVQRFEAIGETPIAAALLQAGKEFQKWRREVRNHSGDRNSIVLVTDGIEECRGDPCAAAAALKNLGIDVKVHIVGFALGAGESNKLQCVVEQTGGRYFDANDVSALQRTLTEVRQIVAAPLRPATKPVAEPVTRPSKLIFEDKFDGKDVAAEWEILNRKPDRFIVEKGALLLSNPAAGGFRQKDAANIVRLKEDLPDGDWDIVVEANPKFQSRSDSFNLGLLTDEKNHLNLSLTFSGSDTCNKVELVISRMSDGDVTNAPKIFSGSGCGLGTFGNEDTAAIIKALEDNGVRMVLQKRDRKYSGVFEIRDWVDSKGKPRQLVTDELTSLRIPGRIAFQVGKLDPKRPSETAVRVDQIQVLAYE